MKANKFIIGIAVCVLAGMAAGCGGSKEAEHETQTLAPGEKPVAEDAFFTTTCDRVKTLIQQNNYAYAKQALDNLLQYQLTPEQQKTVDDLKKQIPKDIKSVF